MVSALHYVLLVGQRLRAATMLQRTLQIGERFDLTLFPMSP